MQPQGVSVHLVDILKVGKRLAPRSHKPHGLERLLLDQETKEAFE